MDLHFEADFTHTPQDEEKDTSGNENVAGRLGFNETRGGWRIDFDSSYMLELDL